MVDTFVQNLFARTKNIHYCNIFFLLFFCINLHESATQNLVYYDRSKHASFVNFIKENLKKECNKCAEIMIARIAKLKSCYENDQKDFDALKSMKELSNAIAEHIDKFRLMLNKDFENWYMCTIFKTQNNQFFYYNDLYNLCAIYNFAMVSVYKKQHDYAKSLLKNHIYKDVYSIKYAAYKEVIKDIIWVTNIMLQNISTLNITSDSKTNTNIENGYLLRSIKEAEEYSKKSSYCDEAIFKNNKTQINNKLKQFLEHKEPELTLEYKDNEDLKIISEQKKKDEKILDEFFDRLYIILEEFEKSYVLLQIYKQHIIDSEDPNGNKHFIDKFSCFYLTLKSFIKYLKEYRRTYVNILLTDTKATLKEQNVYLCHIKANIVIIHNYIKYTKNSVLYVIKSKKYIDHDGKLIKNNKPGVKILIITCMFLQLVRKMQKH
ncbi:hypothetical protein BDAP_001722 [Binucleata daphniae]